MGKGNKKRMKRDGDEMYACTDPQLCQFDDEFVATDVEPVQVQTEHIEVPRMPAMVLVRRELELVDVGERTVVIPDKFDAGPDEAFQLSELMNPDRRLNVCQVVLEPGAQHLVIPIAAIRITV